jgi:hypothetical protein
MHKAHRYKIENLLRTWWRVPIFAEKLWFRWIWVLACLLLY